MEENATYTVLATFRQSEETLKGLEITPLKQSIYKQSESIALPVPQILCKKR